jgi:arylsulfatase A-like enzyme
MNRSGSPQLNRPITRREVIKGAGAGLLSLGLMGLNTPGILQAKQEQPNIVFILSDDHRWDALSHLGHPIAETPNMDRLAQEGVLFENAFCTTSLCSPSRASFLTGQYAHNHGVQNNLTPWDNANQTLFEPLHDAGYETAFIGKWHMPGNLPQLRGLDRFVSFTADAGQGRFFNCPLVVDGKEVPSKKEYITEELTDYSLDFIRQKRDKPFCLYLSHKAVHYQFSPPKDMTDLYEDVDLHLPREADNWVGVTDGQFYPQPMRKLYRDYLACLKAMDIQIGRVLDELDQQGLAENTIVVYAGDNGFFWGEHHLLDKRWPYEESIRIPLLLRYPKRVKQTDQKIKQMVLNIDLAPTLLDLAGIRDVPPMDGESMVPYLKNPDQPGRKAWLYEYFADYPYWVPETFGIRTDTHKYVEYQGRREPELFNLVQDPQEKHNLYPSSIGQSLLNELQADLNRLKQGERL